MNDTPRTDQFEEAYFNNSTSHVDDVFEYARELEREKAALLAVKKLLLKRIRASQKILDSNWYGVAEESSRRCVERNYAAIDAARKAQP